MSRSKSGPRGVLASVLAAVILVSCGVEEPVRRRSIGEDLDLVFDSARSLYFIQRSGDSTDGDGILDAPVVRIGWNDRFVWSECAIPFHSGPTGWMLVDRDRGQQLGPFTPSEMARRAPDICQCDSLESRPVAEVFASAASPSE